MLLNILIHLYIVIYLSSNILAQHYVTDKDGRTKLIAARKGDPPPCAAQPGQTFCEHVENYPYDLVLRLIKNSRFDISKLLVDESLDDGPDITQLNLDTNLPKSNSMHNENIDEENFLNDPEDQAQKFQELKVKRETVQRQFPTHNGKINLSVSWNIRAPEPGLHRHKRQNLNIRSPLCRFISRYVFPQAAMCARTGEWMYVVNVRRHLSSLSQMIKTEICEAGVAGTPCMGDCSDSNLPLGIVSRCNQHYLQKRLITTDGTDILTDMFWLPTCCVCSTYGSTIRT